MAVKKSEIDDRLTHDNELTEKEKSELRRFEAQVDRNIRKQYRGVGIIVMLTALSSALSTECLCAQMLNEIKRRYIKAGWDIRFDPDPRKQWFELS